ncbi:hypothetical protein [Streptomyces nigra]|uniref:hypothetical protein n=1 Tax=Streptomyces nigra TaxID=1827580 RepID=UPI00371FF564
MQDAAGLGVANLHPEDPLRSLESALMPLDQDVNEALFRLHFGFNAPLWGKAIHLQISRLKPIEDLAVRYVAAGKAIAAGSATAGDWATQQELEAALSADPEADRAFKVALHPTAGVDAAFLVIAMRGLLSSAEQMVKQVAPLKKDAILHRAVDAFTSAQPLVKHFRDVIIHNDEYTVGQGRSRKKAITSDEGIGVDQDDTGRILVTWGGRSIILLDAAADAVTLWRALNAEFWGKLTS